VATALLFCAVHGWRDGVPLLPLALLLGQTRRTVPGLLAPVIAHSLFNATNLTLAALTMSHSQA
jgi:membrane protease YdiL (CAAX protease family)